VLRPPGSDAVAAVAVSPDARSVAIGCTTSVVEIWNAASHKVLYRLAVAGGYPRSIAFSPDGTRLAVGMSGRGTVVFALPSLALTSRLTALSRHDAAFIETVSAATIKSFGSDAPRFEACCAGRSVLPISACDHGTKQAR
jgi:WD40 repeat protein